MSGMNTARKHNPSLIIIAVAVIIAIAPGGPGGL